MTINQPTFLLHGADYNYEQWLDYPAVLAEDLRLMRAAHCNVMSVGIFSWAMLEPAEGEYQFEWLDRLMDGLADNGLRAILATPSGAKPAWLAHKYPEVRLVDEYGRRHPHRQRHNHCPTSPIYREKVQQINRQLAERYRKHPALFMWHVSNEYCNFGCRCALCLEAFRDWLRSRYGSLDALNYAWWTTFWSHRYSDWTQIEPVDPSCHGLMLDWLRFCSDQVLDFYRHEIVPLREWTPDVPITTNFMQPNVGLDYWQFAPHVDVIAWDSYPRWHGEQPDNEVAVKTAFFHDLHRSFKARPFLLMESTPSVTNWQGISRPKRPGMHLLSSLQAVAHGANGVQYFQWRQSRGGEEKFHGAVVGHRGGREARIFREVTAVGEHLAQLHHLTTTCNQAEVAIVYDLQNEWALNLAQLPRNVEKNYQEQCIAHYRPFWEMGITADVIDSTQTDFSAYKLVVAPMLYMLREGVAARLADFVQNGGTLVLTYLSGLVNESDLCFVGDSPLRPLLGLWVEETDVLVAHNQQTIEAIPGNVLNLQGIYPVTHYADVLHLEGATAVAHYGHDYYAGQPALTVHEVGHGRAYYLAARTDHTFLADFYGAVRQQVNLLRSLTTPLPEGVTAQVRGDGREQTIFLLNFQPTAQSVDLGTTGYVDVMTGTAVSGTVELPAYGLRILHQDE